MKAVVDANIVFSALVSKGKPFEVFEANKVFRFFEFIAPEYMFSEMDKKLNKLLLYTHLGIEELEDSYSFIKKQISVVSFTEFAEKIPEARELNFKDSPYLALAMKLPCPIISGDKELQKQKKVEVIPPAKALEMILSVKVHNSHTTT